MIQSFGSVFFQTSGSAENISGLNCSSDENYVSIFWNSPSTSVIRFSAASTMLRSFRTLASRLDYAILFSLGVSTVASLRVLENILYHRGNSRLAPLVSSIVSRPQHTIA